MREDRKGRKQGAVGECRVLKRVAHLRALVSSLRPAQPSPGCRDSYPTGVVRGLGHLSHTIVCLSPSKLKAFNLLKFEGTGGPLLPRRVFFLLSPSFVPFLVRTAPRAEGN